VLDVLNLLPVTWGLFESLDDEGSCRGDHIDSCLTILDG
jgi:hypothetical protein